MVIIQNPDDGSLCDTALGGGGGVSNKNPALSTKDTGREILKGMLR